MPVKIKSILFKKSPLRNIVWNRKLNHPCRRLNMTTISMVEPTGGVFSGDLVDYISDRSGFSGVPDLMFHTVTEIEKRLPIERKGIYCSRSGRVKDYLGELQVSQLKRLFLLDKTPNLATYSLTTISDTLLSFLFDLNDKIIPLANRAEFLSVTNLPTMDQRIDKLIDLVAVLPKKNQTTLGFLVRHLQTMGKCTGTDLNSAELAQLFGPLVLGFASASGRLLAIEAMFVLLHLREKHFGSGNNKGYN